MIKLKEVMEKKMLRKGDIFKPQSPGWSEIYLDMGNVLRWHHNGRPIEFSYKNMDREGEIIKKKQEPVSTIDLVTCCLAANGKERQPTAFEVSLVTESAKNERLVYGPLVAAALKFIDKVDKGNPSPLSSYAKFIDALEVINNHQQAK